MTTERDAVDCVVGFAASLRAAGVGASPDRVTAAVEALSRVDPLRRREVYWAARLTLCSRPDEFDRFDAAFDAYFGGPRTYSPPRPRPPRPIRPIATETAPPSPDDQRGTVEQARTAASDLEQLRHRDIRALTPAQREEIRRLVAALRIPPPQRRTRRMRRANAGLVDAGRTVRASLAAAGEPARLRFHEPRPKPRRIVLLLDVSGSMEAYSDILMRFAHAATQAVASPTEVFAVGTRLTRVTRELTQRNPDAAMAAATAAVADAGGGTRLGELLKEFLDRWGQRGTARGAIVVVLSDGWERGDPALLGEQMARLRRLAHRVVWVNPRMGGAGYRPTAGGMAAALPHVDALVAGHSLAAFEHLAEVLHDTVLTDRQKPVFSSS